MTLLDTSYTTVVEELLGNVGSDETQTVAERRKSGGTDQTAHLNIFGRLSAEGSTRTIGEMENREPQIAHVRPTDVVERLIANRVTLLSKRAKSVENGARFALLTARLRKLSPRVSQEDLAACQEITSSLEQISATLARIK